MIEKLKTYNSKEQEGIFYPSRAEYHAKINEIIDVVNTLNQEPRVVDNYGHRWEPYGSHQRCKKCGVIK